MMTGLHRKNIHHRLAFGLLCSVATLGLPVLQPGLAHAQNAAAAQSYNFNIPSKSLASAIADVGAVTGWKIAYAFNLPASVKNPALRGSMTPDQAIGRLLAGSGLRYRIAGARSIVVENGAAASGQAASAAEGTVLDTIVVSDGNSTANDTYQTAAPVSSTNTAELQTRYAGNVNQALRNTPGTFSRPGSNQPGVAVNIRGMSGFGRVNSMIDGVPQTFRNGAGHGAYGGTLLYLHPELVGGVDVTRGAVPGAAGSGTLNGAANFTSLSVEDVLEAGSKRGALTRWKAGSNGQDYAGMAAAAVRGDLYEDGTGEISVLGAWAGAGNSDYLNGANTKFAETNTPHGGLAKIVIKPDDVHSLSLNWVRYQNDFRNSGYMWEVKNDTFSMNYGYNPASELIDTRFNVYYNDTSMLYNRTAGGGSYAGRATEARSWGGDLTNTARMKLTDDIGLKFDTGISLNVDEYGVSAYRGVNQPGRLTKASLFNDATLSYGIFDLTGGLRYDYWNLSGTMQARTQGTGAGGFAECPVGPVNCAAEEVSRDGGRVNPKVTLAAKPTDWLQLYGTYSLTARPPTASESYYGLVGIGAQLGNGIFNNPYLKSETSQGWDVGFNITRDNVLVDNDKLRLKVGYFNNDIKNYITNDLVSIERCAGTSTCYYDSAIWINRPGTTNMSGFEIEGSYDAGFAYANISYTSSKTDAPIGWGVGSGGNADIDILPDDYGMLDVGMRFLDRKLILGGKARYVGEATYATVSWVNDTPDLSTIPAHTILDLYGSYDFNKSTQLFFSVENLGNKVYAAPVSGDGVLLAGRGRTFIVGLTSRIGASGTQSGEGSGFLDLFKPGATPHDWTGFYLGANAGYSGSKNANSMAFTSESGTAYNLNRNLDFQTTLGGLYGGYNQQFGNGLVAGVDADVNLLRSSARTGTFTAYQTNINSRRMEIESRQEWSAALRARLGYSAGAFLPYLSAGLSVAGYDHQLPFSGSYRASTSQPYTTVGGDRNESTTHVGYTVGAGMEYAMSQKTSLRAEFRYTDQFGKESITADGLKLDVKPESIRDFRLGVAYRF